MMKGGSLFFKRLGATMTSYCDSSEFEAESAFGLLEEELDQGTTKIKTPMQYENMKQTLDMGSVNTYDGVRFIVQKNLNLNSAVSHFFWTGSQMIPRPMYQLRVMTASDKLSASVSTDPDFNMECSVTAPLNSGYSVKCNFDSNDQGSSLGVKVDHSDDSSTMQASYVINARDQSIGFSMMQAILPQLSLGGSSLYNISTNKIGMSFGGVFEDGDNVAAAQYDFSTLSAMYFRRVNPNRVHLSTDLTVDAKLESRMSVGAEFILKQSRIQLSLDSDITWRTLLETTVTPMVSLQLSAEVAQLSESYRYGFGITVNQ